MSNPPEITPGPWPAMDMSPPAVAEASIASFGQAEVPNMDPGRREILRGGAAICLSGLFAVQRGSIIGLQTDILRADVTTTIEEEFSPDLREPNCADLVRDFVVSENGLFRAKNELSSGYAAAWASYQGLIAEHTTALAPGQTAYNTAYQTGLSAVIQSYWASVPVDALHAFDPAPTAYVEGGTAPLDDDALWLASLMNLRNPARLGIAEDVFALVASQWNDKAGGGSFWEVQLEDATSHIKAAVSNAPAVALGVICINEPAIERTWIRARRLLTG